jgi:hypothetical protein
MKKDPLHDDTRVGCDTLYSLTLLKIEEYIELTGHNSAASFPTGPVMADPFISPFGLTIYKLSASMLQYHPSPSRQVYPRLHSVPLQVFNPIPKSNKKCTHNTSVVLEVQENTVRSSPWLRLADNNSRHDLLSEFGLSLLDSCHNHITDTTSWQTVKTRTNTLDGNDVQVSCSGVVAAVHHGSARNPSVYICTYSQL